MIGNIRNMRHITGLLSPISKELRNEIFVINKKFQLDKKTQKHIDTKLLESIDIRINEVAKELENEFYNLDKQIQLKNKKITSLELEKRKKLGSRGSYVY